MRRDPQRGLNVQRAVIARRLSAEAIQIQTTDGAGWRSTRQAESWIASRFSFASRSQ
jgi:hypothetical protein